MNMNLFDYAVVVILGIYTVLVLVKTSMLRRQGIDVFSFKIGAGDWRDLLMVYLIVGLWLWIAETLFVALRIDIRIFARNSHVPMFDILWLKIAGLALCITGVVIFIMAMTAFGTGFRVGLAAKDRGGLVTTGVFSVTRNPIYLFSVLLIAGIFLIYGSMFMFSSLLICMLGVHLRILQEEKFLLSHYGEEYKDYMSRTGRYFGRRNY
jgi:protein-S-isoprenylcysteine O-methyltransferase Ste14